MTSESISYAGLWVFLCFIFSFSFTLIPTQDDFDGVCKVLSGSFLLTRQVSRYLRRLAKAENEHAKSLQGIVKHFDETLKDWYCAT